MERPFLDVPEAARQRSVLVAVSGGADSTALAALLAEAKSGPLELAHVGHGLRPAAAAEELAQVHELSRALGVPLHVVELAPPPSFAPGAKIPEAWAREQRYRALAEIAARRGIGVLATGHHARDQRETALLQLLRGAGLRGLAGMRVLRRFAHLWLWRPLLAIEPEALRAELRARGLRWIEDASNRDLRLRRSRVRHALVPELARRGDPLLARLDRLSTLAARIQGRLEQACEKLLESALEGDGATLPLPVVEPLSPFLLRELLDRASLRISGLPLRARRGELEDVLGWALAPRSTGERRIGPLTLRKRRGALRCVKEP